MKNKEDKKLNDYDIEQLIGEVLRYGVVLSGSVAIIGGIWYLFQHGSQAIPAYGVFNGEPAGYTSLGGIYKGLLQGSAKEIIQLGVVFLLATPIVRVLFSLLSFIIEKDRLYIVITLIVLTIIILSTFGGLA